MNQQALRYAGWRLKSAGMKPHNKAITLIELLIAISLIAMVIWGASSIDVFSRSQFFIAERKAKVQNEATYVLSHISKQLAESIGDISNPAVTVSYSGGVTSNLSTVIDSNVDGKRTAGDTTVRYCYNSTGCNAAAAAYTIYFNSNISAVPPPAAEILSSHVRFFNASSCDSNPIINCLKINVVTCWDPSEAHKTCGEIDNPSFNVTNSIRMPSVSAN